MFKEEEKELLNANIGPNYGLFPSFSATRVKYSSQH